MKQYRSESYIEEGAVLHIFTLENAGKEDLHSHDFLELVYILGGDAEECVGGAAYTVGRGDLLLIREGESHSFAGAPTFSYVNLCFDPTHLVREGTSPSAGASLLGRVAFDGILERNGGCLVRFSEGERSEIERLLSVMQGEYRARRCGWQAILRHYLDILFLNISRALEERGTPPPSSDRMWGALASYIDGHLTADLSLVTLSRRLFYNPSYFSRAFSHRFGVSLTEYVASRRADLAARLCEEGSARTVAAVAEGAGFSSKAALYRAFLRHRGEPFGIFFERCKKTNS